MYYLIAVAVGYLVGCINPSYIIAKIKNFDIRKNGSGNAGASNAFITMGAKIGFFSAFFDILKAFFIIKIFSYCLSEIMCVGEVAGVACIVGHIFPITMGFKGGKGLACLGGNILALDWRLFLIMLLAEFFLAYLVDYICIVPLTASIIFPLIYNIMTKKMMGTIIYFMAAILMFFKHVENLKRIHAGTEAHFSYAWNKKKEIDRLEKKTGRLKIKKYGEEAENIREAVVEAMKDAESNEEKA